MELRVRLRYKSTFDFGKGDCLLFDKSLAHALEWLYDEDNFQEEGTLIYCMEGVLPIYIMMSIVTDIYTFALQEYAETNIKDYFLRMEEGFRWYDNKPSLGYLGEEIILGKVHISTSAVILWATYLYVCFRADIDEDNEKFKRAKDVLYKLFWKKTGLKEERVKGTFLMKHFDQTIRDFAMDVLHRYKDDKPAADNKPKQTPFKGDRVNPELFVLRAIDSNDDTKYEDLEDYEVNTILDKLESEGYIKVAWIEGHRPEAIRMLDKGRAYLKHLEEGINDVMPLDSTQNPSDETQIENPGQIPQTVLASGHTQVIPDEEWDDTFDYIFDGRVKPNAIKFVMDGIDIPNKISKVRFFYVVCRILEILQYLTKKATRPDFLRWVNLHFNCGWIDDNEHRKQFVFALEGSSKNLEEQHPSEWNEKTIKGGSGKYHHQLAVTLKNTFTETMVGENAVDNSDSFEHLRDRGQFLRYAYHIKDNEYYIPEKAFINNGK